MKKHSIILLLLISALLVVAMPIKAQISGYIIDAENGDSIPFASVIYKGHGVAVASNIGGRYSIARHNGWQLTFSAVGYVSKVVDVTAKTPSKLIVKLKPDNKMLKEVAEKRLAAIREYSDLGSGCKIAMRDLEIRGAGNLLGAEQSGHMEAVGYDLYCKMLHEAVKEARGEAPAEQFETSVDIRTDAFIPSTYIANESQKLDMYKRIAGIETDEEAEEMLEELIDRFGEPPKSVQNLLTIARLKAVAHSVYIKEIVQREDLLKILMYEKAKIHAQRIPELVKTFAPSLKFAADPKGPYFTYRLGANSREKNREILEVLRQLLEQMHVFLCAEP